MSGSCRPISDIAARTRRAICLLLGAALGLTMPACAPQSSIQHERGLCAVAAAALGVGVGGGLGAAIAAAAGGHGGASAGSIAGATAGGAVLGAALGALFASSYCSRGAVADAAAQPYSTLASAPPPPPAKIVLRGVHFAPGESALSDDDDRILDDHATTLMQHPELRVYVDGYTDSTEAPAQSLELAEQRARAVAEYLHARGVPARQLLPRALGMADSIASNATHDGRARNRRVELLPAD